MTVARCFEVETEADEEMQGERQVRGQEPSSKLPDVHWQAGLHVYSGQLNVYLDLAIKSQEVYEI